MFIPLHWKNATVPWGRGAPPSWKCLRGLPPPPTIRGVSSSLDSPPPGFTPTKKLNTPLVSLSDHSQLECAGRRHDGGVGEVHEAAQPVHLQLQPPDGPEPHLAGRQLSAPADPRVLGPISAHRRWLPGIV